MIAFSRPVWFIVKPLLFVFVAIWRLLKRIGLVERDDPTRKWQKDESKEMVFDLDRSTFCGVGLGDSLDGLHFLGPCDRFSRCRTLNMDEDGSVEIENIDPRVSFSFGFSYPGLTISCDAEFKIAYFMFTFFESPEEPGLRCYSGQFLRDGRLVDPQEMDNSHVVNLTLGEPSHVQQLDDSEDDDLECDEILFEERSSFSMTSLNVPVSEPAPITMKQAYEYEMDTATLLFHFDDQDRTLWLMVMPQFERDEAKRGDDASERDDHVA